MIQVALISGSVSIAYEIVLLFEKDLLFGQDNSLLALRENNQLRSYAYRLLFNLSPLKEQNPSRIKSLSSL